MCDIVATARVVVLYIGLIFSSVCDKTELSALPLRNKLKTHLEWY